MKKIFSTFSVACKNLKNVHASQKTFSTSNNQFFSTSSRCLMNSEKEGEKKVNLPQETEAEKYAFQAQTKRLLDIVAKSLYQDKEVFVRELVSNSSDALEKAKYFEAKNELSQAGQIPLEIRLSVDEANGTLSLEDTGVGMTKAEMIKNLGTIAHSGTGKFLESIEKSSAAAGTASSDKLIGQFGVGFYSIFTVADSVSVYSRSGRTKKNDDESDAEFDTNGHCWTSDGLGSFTITKVDDLPRGTKIVAKMKDGEETKKFLKKEFLENIVKKYSNFVGHPVLIEGTQVNTIKALWTMDKKEINEKEYVDFYKFISHEFTPPMYKLHFSTDSPISIRGIFYTPSYSIQERLGMGRYEPGVSIYSRKVLIAPKSKDILPPWLRFVKGVVDSEDLPLNVSREFLQDSTLIKKLNKLLTTRIIKHFIEEAKNDKDQYKNFWREFGQFISEGIVTDDNGAHKNELAKLLRFNNSNATSEYDTISLDEYVDNMNDKYKNKVYYLLCRSRVSGLLSPYFEIFRKRGIDVLLMTSAVDSYTMEALKTYKEKDLVNIETDISLDEDEEDKKDDASATKSSQTSSSSTAEYPPATPEFLTWFKTTLGSGKVNDVLFSHRLVSSPAIVVNHSSGFTRQATMLMMGVAPPPIEAQKVELNPKHAVIRKLDVVRLKNPEYAEKIANQIFDSALLAAGLLDDPKDMLTRLNTIVEMSLDSTAAASASASASSSSSSSSSTEAATIGTVETITPPTPNTTQ